MGIRQIRNNDHHPQRCIMTWDIAQFKRWDDVTFHSRSSCFTVSIRVCDPQKFIIHGFASLSGPSQKISESPVLAWKKLYLIKWKKHRVFNISPYRLQTSCDGRKKGSTTMHDKWFPWLLRWTEEFSEQKLVAVKWNGIATVEMHEITGDSLFLRLS